jgi:hypothetical protein
VRHSSSLAPDAESPAPSPGWSGWERLGIGFLILVVLLFGILVEIRAAFLKRRMTDLNVYLRAAWAVRTGADLYAITDDNNWHYHYPPLLAILLVPLADPPAGADRTGTLPFAVSAALWYLFSIGCLGFATHSLAGALEESRPGTRVPWATNSRLRWWTLRLVPVLACLPPVGATLVRGQVNLLVLALICAMIAALLRGRSWRAGLWLAGAIGCKLIPVFLLLYPLWRRDLRCLAGCTAGLVLGLGVLPVVVLGPAQAARAYQRWADVVVRPALGAGPDRSRAKELIDVTATDSQSFLAILHNSMYPVRAHRPHQASRGVRLAHWAAAGFLTALTLLAAGWRSAGPGSGEALFLALLTVLMTLVSPVCHLHYFCFSLPLVMAIVAAVWERAGPAWLGPGWMLVLLAHLLAHTLPRLPGQDSLRDLGLAMYGTLLLGLAAGVLLARRPQSVQEAPSPPLDVTAAA